MSEVLSTISVFPEAVDHIHVIADENQVRVIHSGGAVVFHFVGGIRDVMKFMAKFENKDEEYERTAEDEWSHRMEG